MFDMTIYDIYANDRDRPTISITYTLDNANKKNGSPTISMFKMWLRDDVKNDFEIINVANMLYRKVLVYTALPCERDITRWYQHLFNHKLWRKPDIVKTKTTLKRTLKLAPHRGYVEFHKDYMADFVNTIMDKAVQKQMTKGSEAE